jgi:fructose-1-phosphate kinase PfkB-like protein
MAGAATVFNETAPVLTQAELSHITSWLELAPVVDVCIVSGSLPTAMSEFEIAALFRACRNHSRKLVIDTSGKNLIIAAKSGADLVKPNRDEIVEATGLEDLRKAAMSLIELGAISVLISLGEEGAELHNRNGYLIATLPPALGNPTGAGDAMTAASGWALSSGMASTDLIKYACAAGRLAVLEPVAGQLNWTALAEQTANVAVESRK